MATASAVHLLRQKYTTVPAVFSSRKAPVADVKTALEAGALDVLIKPHRSLDNAEGGSIRESWPRTARVGVWAGAASSPDLRYTAGRGGTPQCAPIPSLAAGFPM